MKPMITCCAIAMVAVLVAATRPPTAEFKCAKVPIRFPDAPEPVYVVDAEAVDRDSLLRVDRHQVESIEVACADHIYETFGIKAQRSGMIMFTSPGPGTALQAGMDSVAKLQAAYLARTGRFASTAAELGWSDETGLIAVDLSLAENGARWSATGRHRYLAARETAITVEGRKAEVVE